MSMTASTLIVAYGGCAGFARQLMPIFLGLVLGSFLMALALTMIAFVGQLNQVVVNAPSLGFL